MFVCLTVNPDDGVNRATSFVLRPRRAHIGLCLRQLSCLCVATCIVVGSTATLGQSPPRPHTSDRFQRVAALSRIDAFALDPEGQWHAVATRDGQVTIQNLMGSRRMTMSLPTTLRAESLSFSGGPRFLACLMSDRGSGMAQRLSIFDLDSQETSNVILHESSYFMFFLPAAQEIVIGGSTGVWRCTFQDGGWALQKTLEWPSGIQICGAGQLAIAERQNRAYILVATEPLTKSLFVLDWSGDSIAVRPAGISNAVGGVAVSPDGGLLAIAFETPIRIYDTATYRAIIEFPCFPVRNDRLAFANGGRWLVSARSFYADIAERRPVGRPPVIWDIATNQLLDSTAIPTFSHVAANRACNRIALWTPETCLIGNSSDLDVRPLSSPSFLLKFEGVRFEASADQELADVTLGNTEYLGALSRRVKETLPDDRSLLKLSFVPGVQVVRIISKTVTEAGLSRLSAHKTLKALAVRVETPGITSSWMDSLRDIRSLKALWIDSPTLHEIASLGALRQLKIVRLSLPEVPSQKFSVLESLEGTLVLVLDGCKRLDDDGTAWLAKSGNLEELDLTGTSVGDKTVQRLQGCRNLRELSLAGTQITSAAVPSLVRMTTLRKLDVSSTALTKQDVDQIITALPRCRVMSDGAHRKSVPETKTNR